MMTTTEKRLRSPEYNLEIGTDTPNMRLILAEIEKAGEGMNKYTDRNLSAFASWHSRWEGQAADGRKHTDPERPENEAFPWEGASDTRVRTVNQTIRYYTTVGRFAINGAKIQAQAIRPLAPAPNRTDGPNRTNGGGQGRNSNKVSQLLKWQIGTQLRSAMLREIPLGLNWRNGYGATFWVTDWWQCRRLESHTINLGVLADIVVARAAAEGGQLDPIDAFNQVQSAVYDPAQFGRMVSFIQSLSPIVSTGEARKAVEDLAKLGFADIRVPEVYESQPRIWAARPGVDVLFLDVTGDLQAEPWFAIRERVSETILTDRMRTEDYDPRFVKAAIAQKGSGSDSAWLKQTAWERDTWGGEGYYAGLPGWVDNYGSNSIPLIHFFYKAHVRGVPALFRTILNENVVGRDLKDPLYAWHGLHPYKHGMYPAIESRFEKEFRPILSSRGIAEIAADWEREEKIQADGLADRTSLVHRPPLVGPMSRQGYITGAPLPGSYLGVSRPNEFSWMPLPPPDATPLGVIRMVQERLERFFPIFGGEHLDPALVEMTRQELANDLLGDCERMFDMMRSLDEQYMTDEELAPFGLTREDMAANDDILLKFDAKSLTKDYIKDQVELIGLAMPFNQGGTANTNMLFRGLMELINPDIADMAIENDEVATGREVRETIQAVSEAFNGLDSYADAAPVHANHQLRLQTIMKATINSTNPRMRERLSQNPDTLEILQKMVEFHENQIQQYQKNPQIGRMLGTKTFSQEAPRAALPAS